MIDSSADGIGSATQNVSRGGLTPWVPGEKDELPEDWQELEAEAAWEPEVFELGGEFDIDQDGNIIPVGGPLIVFYADEAVLARKLLAEGMSVKDMVQAIEAKRPPLTNVGLTVSEIIRKIQGRMDDWPRSVGGMLFIDDPVVGLHYFDRHPVDSLFGWLRSRQQVVWKNSGPTKGEVLAELERVAERYDAIERLPHEPKIRGIYYRGIAPKPGDGRRLKQLTDRFYPETTIDRDLIKAAFMTPLWGGPPGKRPIIVVTSDFGRGAGKSTLFEMISYLYGGHFDVSPGSDIERLKTRMLTPSAISIRIAVIDNVKTMRFSWAEFEALVTASVISGDRKYYGEAQRPNLLTWFITVNGASMAPDLAQRSVVIKLAKAEYSGTWLSDTLAFIDKYRNELIGDIIAALRAEPFPLVEYSRWATWERDVLCRLPEPGEAQKLILERQGEANVELDEVEIIEDYVRNELARLNYEPLTIQVRIPNSILAEYYKKATGDFRIKTSGVTRTLKQMITEGTIKRLSLDPSRSNGRGWIWTGEQVDLFSNDAVLDDLAERIRLDREGQFGGGWRGR